MGQSPNADIGFGYTFSSERPFEIHDYKMDYWLVCEYIQENESGPLAVLLKLYDLELGQGSGDGANCYISVKSTHRSHDWNYAGAVNKNVFDVSDIQMTALKHACRLLGVVQSEDPTVFVVCSLG